MRLALQRGGEGRDDGNISSLSLNKIEDAGELPGLMIEEMMESASMVNGEDTDHGKAAKDNGPVCLFSLIPPNYSHFLRQWRALC